MCIKRAAFVFGIQAKSSAKQFSASWPNVVIQGKHKRTVGRYIAPVHSLKTDLC